MGFRSLYKFMSKKTEREAERKEAIEKLQAMLKPGSRVYTILRHVSSSGMSRDISVVIGAGKDIQDITWYAAKAMCDTLRDSKGHRAIRVGGCGMDMGFNLVYNLSRTLFPNGFKPCDAGLNYGRNGTSPNDVDTDGGYALTQEWL